MRRRRRTARLEQISHSVSDSQLASARCSDVARPSERRERTSPEFLLSPSALEHSLTPDRSLEPEFGPSFSSFPAFAASGSSFLSLPGPVLRAHHADLSALPSFSRSRARLYIPLLRPPV